MGDLIEDRVVVVGEVSDILAVYVPEEVVEVQGGELGQAARQPLECRTYSAGTIQP